MYDTYKLTNMYYYFLLLESFLTCHISNSLLSCLFIHLHSPRLISKQTLYGHLGAFYMAKLHLLPVYNLK